MINLLNKLIKLFDFNPIRVISPIRVINPKYNLAHGRVIIAGYWDYF